MSLQFMRLEEFYENPELAGKVNSQQKIIEWWRTKFKINYMDYWDGFDYEQSPNDKLRYVNNLGWYKDSLNSTAYYAGGAAFYDVVGNKDLRFSVGGEITGFYSENYNKGKPFIALVPVANLGNSNYSVNFVLIPRFSQFMESGVAFFQFKMRVK